MSPTTRIVLALALLGLVSGCNQPLTQLVLVVDTDYPIPDGLDHVVLEVEGAAPRSVEVPLATTTLPISLGVVHRAGPLSPITLTASGQRGGIEIVRGVVRTGFVTGETREVRIDLLQRCEGACLSSSDLTCRGGSCVSVDVPAASLPVFTGVPSRSDVGPYDASIDAPVPSDALDAPLDVPEDAPLDAPVLPDAPMDAPVLPDAPMELDAPVGLDAPVELDAPDAPVDACMFTGAETCNGRDDNCDGAIDEGVCVCMPACMLDHATAFCVGGTSCVIASCETGYADCDGMDLTGCERSTRLVTSCGDCTTVCAIPASVSGPARGTTTCATGTCMVATCNNADRRDCDGNVLNGCETDITTSTAHCGRCANPCSGSPARCMGGVCL